jgi:hypothetical protein
MATARSRAAQVARRALALPGVLIAVVAAGLLGSPAIAQGAPAATAQHAVPWDRRDRRPVLPVH